MSDSADFTDAKSTSEMQVANIGFLIDRMGKDAYPLQFLRELTQNSIEAILATPDRRGEVVWDVDWVSYDLTMGKKVKLACIDTGTGIGPEMVRYYSLASDGLRPAGPGGEPNARALPTTRPRSNLRHVRRLPWWPIRAGPLRPARAAGAAPGRR